jgi:uncharacterized protein
MEGYLIFDYIFNGDLEGVKRCVLADPAVLETRTEPFAMTPLMYAIYFHETAIALWLIEHRGQHNLDSTDRRGFTALHRACGLDQLSVAQALVKVGANPACADGKGFTSLMFATLRNRIDVVAFLLQLPAVRVSIDASSLNDFTALSIASFKGHLSIVQLLLRAGADPTNPAGPISPLNLAIIQRNHAIAALLRLAIAKAYCAPVLHKARFFLDAANLLWETATFAVETPPGRIDLSKARLTLIHTDTHCVHTHMHLSMYAHVHKRNPNRTNQLTNHPTNQPTNQAINQPIDHPHPHSHHGQPRWDQGSFGGRARHFFAVTNPLNALATDEELGRAKALLEAYK